MIRGLHLTVTTPMEVLVDVPGVVTLRAEDESGGFGILPGHADFLTALPASVLRWRGAHGVQYFCALRAGLLTVSGGDRVAVACREALLGDDLARLEAKVATLRADEADAARRARVEQMRLHASAVRQLIRYLRSGAPGSLEHPPPMARPDAGDGA